MGEDYVQSQREPETIRHSPTAFPLASSNRFTGSHFPAVCPCASCGDLTGHREHWDFPSNWSLWRGQGMLGAPVQGGGMDGMDGRGFTLRLLPKRSDATEEDGSWWDGCNGGGGGGEHQLTAREQMAWVLIQLHLVASDLSGLDTRGSASRERSGSTDDG
ncbi:hypothetical protein EYF80_052509 [Liparis tanakae]|uniref:Uncharacterized protein n=1 Tax=Liparis tanakae TaxID=230148 RepID=A0A4Z2F7X9_9TELE|nr:hypothetical protein EYF80_052509 [Liparis tanakae]